VRRARRLIFSSFGVPIALSYPRDMESSVEAILPPARTWAPANRAPKRFFLERRGKSLYAFAEDELLIEGEDARLVLDILDSFIREHISADAPHHVFIHAGAVAIGGVALVLPAPSLAGKSTLVAALVRAGATYLSDEYAVLDGDGKVIPYPRAISLRLPGTSSSTEVDAASLGQVASDDPRPVGVVALTEYIPGATWDPVRLTPGVGALRVFENAVTAATRPEQSLTVIRRAVEGAVVLDGPRGESEGLVPALIEEVQAFVDSGGRASVKSD
jgi:hypothetical protein